MGMINVNRVSLKYLTWQKVKSIMAGVKRKKAGFCHVEFDLEEVVVEKDLRIHHKCTSPSLGGTVGAPRGTETLKPGTYYHLVMEYTVK